MPSMTIVVTEDDARNELIRRGRLEGNLPEGYVASANPALRMSGDDIAAVLGLPEQPKKLGRQAKPARKGKAKAAAATTTTVPKVDRRIIEMTDLQRAIRDHLYAAVGGGEEYRRLMDEAGVPRRVRKGETIDARRVSGNHTKGNLKKSRAFAKAHGVSA